MNFKINNKTGSPVKYEKEIHSLCNFAQNRLGFKKPPSIFLDHSSKNAANVLGKTGYYDPNTMEIHVFATGRHPKDILRSIAHELVHHNQNERGELEDSGYMGKGYAQKNPHMRKMELQANDPMLFRDWEDSLKEKENTIYNERRNRKMSFKDWKNKELSENLNKKWGFKMDLGKLTEASKPDYLDLDKDGDKEESMKDAAADKKGEGEGEGDDNKEEEGEGAENAPGQDKKDIKRAKNAPGQDRKSAKKGKINPGLQKYLDSKKKGKK